jgi:hypothetical protein
MQTDRIAFLISVLLEFPRIILKKSLFKNLDSGKDAWYIEKSDFGVATE